MATYQDFNDLPARVQSRILEAGEPDPRTWVLTKIPALGGRSIIEVMNVEDGESQVAVFLTQVSGKFR